MEYNKEKKEFYVKEFRRFLVQHAYYSKFIDLMAEDTLEDLFDRFESKNIDYYYLVKKGIFTKLLFDTMMKGEMHNRWIYFYEKFEKSFGREIVLPHPTSETFFNHKPISCKDNG